MNEQNLIELQTLNPKSPRFSELLAQTQKLSVHPENYDGPCECKECASDWADKGETV